MDNNLHFHFKPCALEYLIFHALYLLQQHHHFASGFQLVLTAYFWSSGPTHEYFLWDATEGNK